MTNYTFKCVEIFADLSEEFAQMVVSRKDFPKFMELGTCLESALESGRKLTAFSIETPMVSIDHSFTLISGINLQILAHDTTTISCSIVISYLIPQCNNRGVVKVVS